MASYVADATIIPDGYRQIFPTSVSGVGGGNGRVALIQCLNQNVRWRDDGGNPTTSLGNRLHAGESMWYFGDLRAIRFIEEASGAELNIATYQ